MKYQSSGIVWAVLGIIYGVGGVLVNQGWWWIGGSAFLAIVAVTTPIWRQWLPEIDEKK
ncbi:MAG: hypothetical protein KC435_11275 [Thermomicrobiales bacterium]|nr:hypothetical protein [Thermomicrobiales bacterium]